MNDFIDVEGASGGRYRFRLMRNLDELPATAGAFVFVRREAGGVQVVACGSANSLMDVGKLWGRAVEQHQAQGLYVYLSVARRMRTEVRQDIAEKHRPALVSVELDR